MIAMIANQIGIKNRDSFSGGVGPKAKVQTTEIRVQTTEIRV